MLDLHSWSIAIYIMSTRKEGLSRYVNDMRRNRMRTTERTVFACGQSQLRYGLVLLLHHIRYNTTLDLSSRSLWHIVREVDLLLVSGNMGNGHKNPAFFGTLNLANFSANQFRSSSPRSFWPPFNTIATPTSWPYISSGIANETASETAG